MMVSLWDRQSAHHVRSQGNGPVDNQPCSGHFYFIFWDEGQVLEGGRNVSGCICEH